MLYTAQLYSFSPTGGTRACGEMFCKAVASNVTYTDLLLRGPIAAPEGDLVVFAVPVFGGRIPAVAAERIRGLQGSGKKAVTMAVYGTRAYEDALLELNNEVTAAGFRIVASAAVVAQHSVVPAVGQGRPDAEDKASIAGFAAKVLEKLASGSDVPVAVPGNEPYKEGMNLPVAPICLPACGSCGNCVAICPTGAMTLENGTVETDADKCILCMACVAACPGAARVLPTPLQTSMDEKLGGLIGLRRENEYFL